MARVRNIKGIGKAKPILARHFIPPAFSPVWKIEVVTDTDTFDVTEILVDGNYTDGVTSTIGSFEFRILDPNNYYTSKFEEFDTINVYLDYGKTAITKRFTGKIERLSNQEQIYLTLSGRNIAMITTGVNVTYSTDGYMARSTILKNIINKYFNGVVSTSGIEDDLTEINGNWEEIPFWNIVEELCTSGGRDAYINTSTEFQYFTKDSRKNTTEAVVESINLVDSSDYARDTEDIYTNVRVYGKKIGNIPIIATSSSDTTYTKGIIKERKIDNSSIDSTIQATELANAEFSDKKLPPTIGTIKSLLLPTLLPGEFVQISNPTNNISPNYYSINSYKHVFSIDSNPETELIVKKQRMELSTILKSTIRFRSDIPDNSNKNDMDFSHVIDFTKDSGTFINTVRNEDRLKVKSGSGSGQWISDLIELDNDVAKIEFRMTGDYLTKQYGATTSYIWFSLNGGTTWKVYGFGTVEVPSGRDLKIRIDLNSSDAIVEAVAVFYKF